jgi:hypothetical protein
MSYVRAEAITTRLREVLEQSSGVLRTVPSSRFFGDLPEGLDMGEEIRRAIENPRINANVTRVRRSPASPPINGNLTIYDFEVEVRIVRIMSTLEQLDDASLELLRSRAFEDVDVIRQALEYPGNLTTTDGGDVTDIASGMLRFVDGTVGDIKRMINEGAQQCETLVNFTGVAIARPATS